MIRHSYSYKVVSPISLVPIWHHTLLLQYCWLYSLWCNLHPHDNSVTTNMYFSNPQPFLPTHQPIRQLPKCFLYLWVYFCLLVHLFCFLDSIYKWNHPAFVFLWLVSLSTIPSMSIDVVAGNKISFFVVADLYFFLYMYSFFLIHSSILMEV